MSEDGSEIVSPDGQYRWDGSTWIPVVGAVPVPHPTPTLSASWSAPTVLPVGVPAQRRRKAGPNLPRIPGGVGVVGGLVAVVLVIGIALLATKGSPHSLPAAKGIPQLAVATDAATTTPPTVPLATPTPVTHEITGTLVVDDFSDLALSPIETANGFQTDQLYNKTGNLDEQIRFLNSLQAGTTYSCADGLGGGFSDITTATGVTVTDGNNQVIATGVLTGGVMDAGGCHFDFQIAVPEVAFYQITVSHRGALTYSLAQMQTAGWQVSSHLG